MRPVQKLQYKRTSKKEFLKTYTDYVKERLRKFKIKRKKAKQVGGIGGLSAVPDLAQINIPEEESIEDENFDASLKELVDKSMKEQGKVILRPALGKTLFC